MVCSPSYSRPPGPGDSGVQRTSPGEGFVLCGSALWREEPQPGRGVRKQEHKITVSFSFQPADICKPLRSYFRMTQSYVRSIRFGTAIIHISPKDELIMFFNRKNDLSGLMPHLILSHLFCCSCHSSLHGDSASKTKRWYFNSFQLITGIVAF